MLSKLLRWDLVRGLSFLALAASACVIDAEVQAQSVRLPSANEVFQDGEVDFQLQKANARRDALLQIRFESLFARLALQDYAAIDAMCSGGLPGQEIVPKLKKLAADKAGVSLHSVKIKKVADDGLVEAVVTIELRLNGTFADSGKPAFPDYPLEFEVIFNRRGGDWLFRALDLDFDRAVIQRQIFAFYDHWAKKNPEAMADLFPVLPSTSKYAGVALYRAKALVNDTGRFKIVSVDVKDLKMKGNQALAHVIVVQSLRKKDKDEYVDQAPIEIDWELGKPKGDWQWKLISFQPHQRATP